MNIFQLSESLAILSNANIQDVPTDMIAAIVWLKRSDVNPYVENGTDISIMVKMYEVVQI